jgi:hypothetical protein
LLPTYVNRQSQPEILRADDPRFAEVKQYLEAMTAEAKLNGRYSIVGDELVLE